MKYGHCKRCGKFAILFEGICLSCREKRENQKVKGNASPKSTRRIGVRGDGNGIQINPSQEEFSPQPRAKNHPSRSSVKNVAKVAETQLNAGSSVPAATFRWRGHVHGVSQRHQVFTRARAFLPKYEIGWLICRNLP